MVRAVAQIGKARKKKKKSENGVGQQELAPGLGGTASAKGASTVMLVDVVRNNNYHGKFD